MICIRRHIDRKLFFVDSIDPVEVLFAAIKTWYGISLDTSGIEVLQDFTSAYNNYACKYLEVVNLQRETLRNKKGGIIPPLWVMAIRSDWVMQNVIGRDLLNSIHSIERGLDRETDLAKDVSRLLRG